MKKLILIWALSLILLSSISINAQTVLKDTSQVANEILKLKAQNDTLKMEFEKVKKDNYEKAMEGAKRSTEYANLIIKIVGLIVAIMSGFGIFSYVKTGQIRKKVEEDSEKIRRLREDCEQEFKKTVNLRSSIESLKTEAETVIKNVKVVFEDIKKIGEDIEKAGKEIKKDKLSVDESKAEVSAISAFTEGWSLGEVGKYEESIEKYKKAIELKPDYASAYNNWGVVLGKLGKHEEEMEKYVKARELKPDNAVVWFNIACVYSLQNNKKEALENLKKAIELDPKYKEQAKEDEDFKNLWEDEDFKRLVE